MLDFLRKLFASDFMAHGYCYLWRPEIVWLDVGSDALITLAYYSIPVTLVCFVWKRRDLPFHWIFVMFGAFILSCGTNSLYGSVDHLARDIAAFGHHQAGYRWALIEHRRGPGADFT